MSTIAVLPGLSTAISATTTGASADNNAATDVPSFDSVLGQQMNAPAEPEKPSTPSEKPEDKVTTEAQASSLPDPNSPPIDILNLIIRGQAQTELIQQGSFANTINQLPPTESKSSDQLSTLGPALDSSQAQTELIQQSSFANTNNQLSPTESKSSDQLSTLGPALDSSQAQTELIQQSSFANTINQLPPTESKSSDQLSTLGPALDSSQAQTELIQQSSFANTNNQLSPTESQNSIGDNQVFKDESKVPGKSMQTEFTNTDSKQQPVESSQTSSEQAFILDNTVASMRAAESRPNLFETEPLKTAPPVLAQYSITTHFNESGWNEAVNNRVIWMANNQVQSAQLTVNPENLGPIQIHVEIDAKQVANVQFFVAHSEVKQALQDSLPNLSDMFAQSGISLGQSNVDSQPSQSQQSFNKPSKRQDSSQINHEDIDTITVNSPKIIGSGIINTTA